MTWVDMGVRGDLVLISKTMHRRERSGKCVHTGNLSFNALADNSFGGFKSVCCKEPTNYYIVWCAFISSRKDRQWDPE